MGESVEPPSKKVKVGQEFIDLIEECYDLTFSDGESISEEKNARLASGIEQIRKILEQIQSSNEISFAPTRSSSRINWAKCVSLMLETGPESLKSLKNLTGRLSPGGGLL